MAASAVFGSRLDLLVRLIDTTTGAAVEESNVMFLRDGIQVRPEPRGDGQYVFINTGREDFLMRIVVYGFDEYSTFVEYGLLDERLPVCDVFLMPSENTFRGQTLLRFEGTLPFLKTIEAVSLSRMVCTFSAYEPKKRLLQVFSGGERSHLEEKFYGILNADRTGYEKIEIERTVTDRSVSLKKPITGEFAVNSPITRIIHGTVSKDGGYLLKVRDDGEDQRYIVRYEVGEETLFQTVDFREKGVRLHDPAGSDERTGTVQLRDGSGSGKGDIESDGIG
ncbi:MAG: hypothetical protein IJT16_09475 [Lachnospiraceae bacterium]|nr:hypothetical protein [Lachnospiraceae bacterium]